MKIHNIKDNVQITGSSGGEGGPHKLMVGDWIAQYDTTYSAWFFYNIKTGTDR